MEAFNPTQSGSGAYSVCHETSNGPRKYITHLLLSASLLVKQLKFNQAQSAYVKLIALANKPATSADDAEHIICELLSQANSYLTGQIFSVKPGDLSLFIYRTLLRTSVLNKIHNHDARLQYRKQIFSDMVDTVFDRIHIALQAHHCHNVAIVCQKLLKAAEEFGVDEVQKIATRLLSIAVLLLDECSDEPINLSYSLYKLIEQPNIYPALSPDMKHLLSETKRWHIETKLLESKMGPQPQSSPKRSSTPRNPLARLSGGDHTKWKSEYPPTNRISAAHGAGHWKSEFPLNSTEDSSSGSRSPSQLSPSSDRRRASSSESQHRGSPRKISPRAFVWSAVRDIRNSK
jgi:hypothetical protein